MNWLGEVSSNNIFEDFNVVNGQLSINKIEIKSITKNTIVSDFFVLMYFRVGEANNVIRLPTPNNKIYNQILMEIAPYFNEIQIEKINTNPDTIQLRYLKEQSHIMLNKNTFHPMLQELFHHKESDEQAGEKIEFTPIQNKSVYRVNSNFIEELKDNEFTELFQFLEEAYTLQKDFIFSPSTHYLSESIKELKFIRFASHYCRDLYLWVDNDSKKIFDIHLKF
jgi:hypothetical protein